MINRGHVLQGSMIAIAVALAGRFMPVGPAQAAGHVTHSDDEWKKLLTPDQYDVLRHEGTERPFTSELLHEARNGTFSCAGCDLALFSSKTKFDSGTGWPSFWSPLDGGVAEIKDTSFCMVRTAVSCARCNGHLGHVFDDGPKPPGLRYCMNGVAMRFAADAA